MAWHPKANFLIAGTAGGAAYMFDVPGGNMTFFGGHQAPVSALAWAPDGTRHARPWTYVHAGLLTQASTRGAGRPYVRDGVGGGLAHLVEPQDGPGARAD